MTSFTLNTDCPSDWSFFNGYCYEFLKSEDPLSWVEAETICNEDGGNLLSIHSEEEMVFIHHTLIKRWISEANMIFIGKKDFMEW